MRKLAPVIVTDLNCNTMFTADLRKPLMGTIQDQQGVISLPANRPSQAIVDVSENMRAKIYSMFCKLGELRVSLFEFVLSICV